MIRKQVQEIEKAGEKHKMKIKAMKYEAEDVVLAEVNPKFRRNQGSRNSMQTPGKAANIGSHLKTGSYTSRKNAERLENSGQTGDFSRYEDSPIKEVKDKVQLEAQEKLMRAKMVELTSKIKLLDAFVDK